jgi:histidine ammonia-lyase
VSDRIEKDLLAVMRQAQINEKREAVVARKKLNAAQAIQARSKRRMKDSKTSNRDFGAKAELKSISSDRVPVAAPPPPPVLKLERFTGGLSVWD